jgi:hypothetical protein
MGIIIALMATLLMSALGGALVLTTSSEALIAANFRDARAGVYAADAALGRAVDDLASVSEWDSVLDGSTRSTFTDGPPNGVRALADGKSLDLDRTVNMANCRKVTPCSSANLAAVTAQRPWGANNPIWRLFAYGPLSNLLPPQAIDSVHYVVVMVADDASENDADPLHDGRLATNPGAGVVIMRAEAFGPRGSRQIVEMTVGRPPIPAQNGQGLRMLSWRLVR